MMLLLAAAMSASIHQRGAAAQTASIKTGDELRPIYAKPADVADGKQFADSACAGCHGANGISTTTGIPDLAGQRPVYLYMALRAYQSGARINAAMNTSVKFTSDAALVKVAAYYASLDPPQPPAGAAPTFLDPMLAGKTAAAAACAGCHGEAGVTTTPGFPSLVALTPQYLTTAMKAYRSGQRQNDTMKSMLAAIGDADINHIALFYALQKPSRAQTPAPGDQQAGKASTVGCAGCHGDQGVSSNPATPSLAGQDAEYLVAALRAYKNGARADETMKTLAGPLDDDYDEKYSGVLCRPGATSAEHPTALDHTGMDAEVRPLPWTERQQHRPANSRLGRTARRVFADGSARISNRRAHELRDARYVRCPQR